MSTIKTNEGMVSQGESLQELRFVRIATYGLFGATLEKKCKLVNGLKGKTDVKLHRTKSHGHITNSVTSAISLTSPRGTFLVHK